jgi:hypothetical protein
LHAILHKAIGKVTIQYAGSPGSVAVIVAAPRCRGVITGFDNFGTAAVCSVWVRRIDACARAGFNRLAGTGDLVAFDDDGAATLVANGWNVSEVLGHAERELTRTGHDPASG